MTTYNFSQVSDFEFEALCRDLLQAELERPLELFAPGPDGGIDIRYVGVVSGERRTIVAQCKRWKEDSFGSLLSHLTTVELPKIQKLAPGQYILMTSVALTPKRKEKVVEKLQPWIRTPKDVMGRDDLSGLLARHEEVERRHIKLWLTSTEVLDAILNSGIATRTEGAVEWAQRQLRLWVPNPSFGRALDILDANHVCVISGAPGIGKTMLADVLMAGFTSQGYEPAVISDDIDEGDRVWRSGQRQVFYYDDFLGHVTYGELRLRKNEGSRLARFLERVRGSKDKRFILTTREYILAEALRRYERLSDVEVGHYKTIVALDDYTPALRARILYNHLFFSDLPPRLKAALVPDGRYWDVIKHRNYNPRVIRHAVGFPSMADLSPEEFVSNMIGTLDNPTSVWERIFDNLPLMARRILAAMASFPGQVLLEDLRAAVRSLSPTNFDAGAFQNALSMVEGTFLKVGEAGPGSGKPERIVEIREPSVRDYLWSRLKAIDGEAELLLERAIFFEQCVILYEGRSHVAALSGRSPGRMMRDVESGAVVDPEPVASKALDLIGSSNPRLIRVTGIGPDYLRRDCPGLERRAAFLADVLSKHRTSRVVATSAASALATTRAEWEAGRGSASEGIDLLKQAKKVDTLLPRDALLQAEQAFLSFIPGLLDETEGFTALVALADLTPQLFESPHRSLESWAKEFRDFLELEESWLLNELDDPDLIEQELGEVASVADVLGVDIGETLAAAEERITELESKLAYQNYDDDWRRLSLETEQATSEEEIDALFQSLL